MDRQTEGQIEGRTDRKKDNLGRQAEHTESTNKSMDRQKEGHIEGWTDKSMDRQKEGQIEGRTERKKDILKEE